MVNRLRVAGTGHYLPERIVTNEHFEGRKTRLYDNKGNPVSDEKILTEAEILRLTGGRRDPKKGINERRYIRTGETPSSMGTSAAIKAIDEAMQAGELDHPKNLAGIIVGTVTEEENFPAAACKIQENIEGHYNFEHMTGCFSYDISAACAGGVVALEEAHMRAQIRPGTYLVVGSEDVPSMWEEEDGNKFLFGAAAGAALLVPSEDERGIITTYARTFTHGDRTKWINRDPQRYGRMWKGGEVLEEAIFGMTEGLEIIKAQAGWDRADVYIPHQANGRILDKIEKKLRGDKAIFHRTIHYTGNTSSATNLLGLDVARKEGIIERGTKVGLTAAGAGMAIAAAAIQF